MNLPPPFSDLNKSVEELKIQDKAKRMLADFLLEAMLENVDEDKNIDLLVMREHRKLSDATDKHMKVLILNENSTTEEHKRKKEELLELLKKITLEVENFDSTISSNSEVAENSQT